MDNQEIARVCERVEMTAWADMINGAPLDFSHEFGLGVEYFDQIGALHCVGVGGEVTLINRVLNRVMNIGIHEQATERLIDDIIAHYIRLGIRRFAFQIASTAQPSKIGEWLTKRGFTNNGDWVKLYRSALPSERVPTDLRIEEVSSDQGEIFAQVLSIGTGLPDHIQPLIMGMVNRPGWYPYMAYAGSQAVATGALYVKDGVGWLGGAATLPSHRQRGGQSAIMRQRISDGIALGCKWFVTETGAEHPDQPNPSFHNMLRAGFQVGYFRTDYLSPEN